MQGDFRIGDWLIQPQIHTIEGNGKVIRAEPKAIQVLVYLAEHAEQVVSKEKLISAVWADTFVTDDVLTRCISELRKAFDEDAKNPTIIETIPKSGYRLVARVQYVEAEAAVVQAPPRRWPLALGLAAGLGVVGVVVALNIGGLRERMFGVTQRTQVQSLAVLPLENISRDPDQEYFADGITEELITNLAKIGALRVISRTSAMNYKGAHKPLPEIARALNVDAVIVGTVQQSGGRVRVSAQLIDGRTDRHLWAESYERDLRDVLELEGELARAIAGEIEVKLTPQDQARLGNTRRLKPEAHEAYLRGQYFWNKLNEEGVRKSIEYYQKAIELEPGYAAAYAALAFSYNMLASSEFVSPQTAYPQAKKLAQKALELDPSLGDAHAAHGFVVCYWEWEWPAAEEEFKRAIALNPNGGTGHHVYALYLGEMGRSEESIAEMRKALELDPVSVLAQRNLGWLYKVAHQPEKAIEQYRKVLEMDPNSGDGHSGLGSVYVLLGRHAEAIAELREARRLSEDDALVLAYLSCAHAAAGNRREAQKLIRELEQMSTRRYVAPYYVAMVYAALGEREQTFRWLAKALEERNDSLVDLKVDPAFAPLHSDPRFQDLLRRMNFPP